MTNSPPGRPATQSLVKPVVALVVLVAAASAGYAAYLRFFGSTRVTAPAAQVQAVRRGSVTAVVNTTGTVVAVNSANLSFRSGGTLKELNVQVGDSVKKGQPLARIDTVDLEIALRQQRAGLASAQAKLSQLAAGPTDSDIQSALGEVASAQSNLAKAQADFATLTRPPSPDDLAQAAAEIEKARIALQSAQSAYDRVSWRGAEASAAEATALHSATADYASAQAAYNLKNAPPKDSDLAVARKAVESANASVDTANLKLAQVKAGPLASDLQAARASVEVAEVQVASAELDLQRAVLTAPFDGVIKSITAGVGEIVSGAFIALVDTVNLRIDATVDENDVAKIVLGQDVSATFDALPGRTFRGKVVAIAPVAVITQGVSTYLISVQIESPEGVKAGMTANAAITVDRRDNVLVVPNRAVRVLGRERVVELQTSPGFAEARSIQIGLANDQVSEVVSGLNEGDQVVIAATADRPGNVPGVTGGGFGGGPGGFGGR